MAEAVSLNIVCLMSETFETNSRYCLSSRSLKIPMLFASATTSAVPEPAAKSTRKSWKAG